MTYSMYPEKEILSPFGKLRIVATSADHIYVATDGDKAITVNNVGYTLSMHFDCVNGVWTFDARHMHMSRYKPADWRNTDPSKAALRKVQAWASGIFAPTIPEQGASLFLKAEQGHLERDIRAYTESIENLRKNLADLEASKAEAEQKLKAVQSRIRLENSDFGHIDVAHAIHTIQLDGFTFQSDSLTDVAPFQVERIEKRLEGNIYKWLLFGSPEYPDGLGVSPYYPLTYRRTK